MLYLGWEGTSQSIILPKGVKVRFWNFANDCWWDVGDVWRWICRNVCWKITVRIDGGLSNHVKFVRTRGARTPIMERGNWFDKVWFGRGVVGIPTSLCWLRNINGVPSLVGGRWGHRKLAQRPKFGRFCIWTGFPEQQFYWQSWLWHEKLMAHSNETRVLCCLS